MRISVLAACVAALLSWSAAALALTDTPPRRDPDNVIVAFYNIQWVGEKAHNFADLAKVIRNFDVCAVIEVKNERALSQLAAELEDLTQQRWGFAFGVRTRRPGGRYHEAYGVLWRKDRVEFGHGLVGGVWDLGEKFRNDPFLAAFKADGLDFLMMAAHTRWSDDPEGTREGEVQAIAEQVVYLRGFLEEDDILVGGDFNYPGANANMRNMARDANLSQLDDDDKTTYKRDGSGYASAYDHIYATESAGARAEGRAQALDVTKFIYGDRSPEHMDRAKSELSDHLPVFVVLKRTATQ